MITPQRVNKKANSSVHSTTNLVSITTIMDDKNNLINGTNFQKVFGRLVENKDPKLELTNNQNSPEISVPAQTGVSPVSKSGVSVSDGSTGDAEKNGICQEDDHSLPEQKIETNLNHAPFIYMEKIFH